MKYLLKPNSPEFDLVDGPDAGKRYRHGVRYDAVPAGHEDKFAAAEAAKPAAKAHPARAASRITAAPVTRSVSEDAETPAKPAKPESQAGKED